MQVFGKDIQVGKLVVIDHDFIHNFITKKLIDKLNLAERLRVISSASEAIDFFEKSCIKKTEEICPDLVLLDYMFPDMNAIELLEEINSRGLKFDNSIVVLIISSSAIRPEDEKRLRELNAKGFLTKPISEEQINNALEIYLREKKV